MRVPPCMLYLLHGPPRLPFARCGVEITDQPLCRREHAHHGREWETRRWRRIEREDTFVKGLHSIGDLSPDRRFINAFPEELTIRA